MYSPLRRDTIKSSLFIIIALCLCRGEITCTISLSGLGLGRGEVGSRSHSVPVLFQAHPVLLKDSWSLQNTHKGWKWEHPDGKLHGKKPQREMGPFCPQHPLAMTHMINAHVRFQEKICLFRKNSMFSIVREPKLSNPACFHFAFSAKKLAPKMY